MNGSITHLDWTPIFEWCEIRCGSKNGNSNEENLCILFDVPAKHFVYLDVFRTDFVHIVSL